MARPPPSGRPPELKEGQEEGNELNAQKRSGQKDDHGCELSLTRSVATVKVIPKGKANSGEASTSCHAASDGLGGELSPTVSGRRQTAGGGQEYVSQVDEVRGRAMDQLGLIAANAAQHPKSQPSSVPNASVTFADLVGTAGSGLLRAPIPTLRAWVMGDYFTETLNALCALGLASKNVRCRRNVRDPHGPRLDQLEVEKPDLVLVNALRSTAIPRGLDEGPKHAQGIQLPSDRFVFREQLWTRIDYFVYALIL